MGRRQNLGPASVSNKGCEACRLVAEIPTWMGSLAKYTVHAISTTEVQELLQGLKHLEKEDFRKVHLELSNRLSSLQLGQSNSSLSASAKPFVPLATSFCYCNRNTASWWHNPPFEGSTEVTRPLYTTDDDGFTTDAAHQRKRRTSEVNEGSTMDIIVLPVTPESATVGQTIWPRPTEEDMVGRRRRLE